MYIKTRHTWLAVVVLTSVLCATPTIVGGLAYAEDIIPNGSFEADPPGTEKDDITDWEYEIVVHQGNPPTGDDLEIVDDYYFEGAQAVYSYLHTTSIPPFPGDSRVSQYLSTEQPVSTTAGYITLWVTGEDYTTSSRYAWHRALVLEDGEDTYEETLRCDCWGNNEGCTPNHYDYYDEIRTGADGRDWKRYTRAIPPELDKSNLTVTVKHYQKSWDLTQASSWYRLDSIYFSDSQGSPCGADVAVTNVTLSETVVVQGRSISIDVTVENQSNCPETFDVTTYYKRIISNGDFEKDPPGTSFDDISDWDYELIVHQGNPPTGNDLEIVDDYYFEGDQAVYSYLHTTSIPPFPGDSRVSQYLSTEQPVSTTAGYITLWVTGEDYTTSSRYAWHRALVLEDGEDTYEETLRCDCWGNNEGCTPNHYDYYDEIRTGADGRDWKRYTRAIPPELDKSNLTVTVKHYQKSWDLTQASSWYRLDSLYFSDADGNPISSSIPIETKTVTDLPSGEETILDFTWDTTGVAPGDYVISAYAHPVPGETDTDDNTYIDGVCQVRPRPKRPMAEDCATIYPYDRCSASGTCATDGDCANESHCVITPGTEPPEGVCYAPKTRYISIARNPEQEPDTARRVKLDNGTQLGWVGEPTQHPATGLWLAGIVSESNRVYKDEWPDVVHVMGCEIAHASLSDVTEQHCKPNPIAGENCVEHCYIVQGIAGTGDINNEDEYSEELVLCTNSTWGDTVTSGPGGLLQPPDGVPGLADIMAAIAYFQGDTSVAPLTWLDIADSVGTGVPDQVVGLGDIMGAIAGFQGEPYPGLGPLGCSP